MSAVGGRVWAVAGPRCASPLVEVQARELLPRIMSVGSLVVGCCCGFDAIAIRLAGPEGCRVHAIFGESGEGAAPARLSALVAVEQHRRHGGVVRWWSGGPFSIPVGARLAARTRSVIEYANAGLLVWLADDNWSLLSVFLSIFLVLFLILLSSLLSHVFILFSFF